MLTGIEVKTITDAEDLLGFGDVSSARATGNGAQSRLVAGSRSKTELARHNPYEEQLEDGGSQLFPERANRRARQFKNLKREVSAMAIYPDSGSLELCLQLKSELLVLNRFQYAYFYSLLRVDD